MKDFRKKEFMSEEGEGKVVVEVEKE